MQVARDPRIRWLLLGFHRPVFGADLLGGVVKEILERSRGMALDVGVVVHGHDRPVDKIIAVVDAGNNGRAALDLASRVALQKKCSLHAVLAPKQAGEPEPELQEMLKEAARSAGRWLHTDVLADRNPAQLAYKTQGPLVVIGVHLADELGLPLDDGPDGGERCVILVQGGAFSRPPARYRTISTPMRVRVGRPNALSVLACAQVKSSICATCTSCTPAVSGAVTVNACDCAVDTENFGWRRQRRCSPAPPGPRRTSLPAPAQGNVLPEQPPDWYQIR